MATTTPALALRKPDVNDDIDVDEDINANTDKLDLIVGRGAPQVRTLADASPIATNTTLGRRFRVSIAADRTLAVPTGPPVDGQEVVWEVTAVGAQRTLTLATGAGGFEFGSDFTALTPIVSGTTDYIGCVFNATRNRFRVTSYAKGFPA